MKMIVKIAIKNKMGTLNNNVKETPKARIKKRKER